MREEEDPWQHNDPWKQYLHKTRPIDTATSAAPRQIAAPTEERFQEQDKRFQNIEAALKEVQQAQTAMSSDSKQLRQDVQVEIASVRTNVSSVEGEIERQMKANMDAVQQAIQAQQNQMSAGFDEIKALLQAGQKHSRRGPPAKRDSAHPAEEPGGMNDLRKLLETKGEQLVPAGYGSLYVGAALAEILINGISYLLCCSMWPGFDWHRISGRPTLGVSKTLHMCLSPGHTFQE